MTIEIDLPSSIKEVQLLITSKEYSSAVKNINKYLKLWPLEQEFYISKVFCELKLHKYHSCLATIATFHGQLYKPKNKNINTLNVSKEHIINGLCKWLHLEQSLALYKLGKYNLALQALALCKANSPVLALTKEINLQNNSYSGCEIDDFLGIAAHLSTTEHPKYLHLLAQILFKLEKYDDSITIYNHLLTKYYKDQEIITNNIIASHLMYNGNFNDNYEKYQFLESLLQKHLDYKNIKNFELAFNSSLIEAIGGKIYDSLAYLDMAEDIITDEYSENLNKIEILLLKAQRSYLKMLNNDIEAEAYNTLFLDYIESKPIMTTALLKVATNILIYTKNIKTKHDMLSFIMSSPISRLGLTKYELEIFYKNILTSQLKLGLINDFQTSLSGIKSRYPNHNCLILFIASLYYAQNRIQKCEQILSNNLSMDSQKEILALMNLHYMQKKFNKVISIYSSFKNLTGDYLHKAFNLVLKSIKEMGGWEGMEILIIEYEKSCQNQSTMPYGDNLLIIAMLYLKNRLYDSACTIYKRILFGDYSYSTSVLDQAASGLAFAESFTDDYSLWAEDEGDRSALATKFQQKIYDKIKFIESENLEMEGIAYIHSCKIPLTEEIKRKSKHRKRSRINKIQQCILALGPPDPERWIPKYQRSGFKKSKKKKKDDIMSKATQGSVAPPSAPKPTTANITTIPSTQKRKKRR